LEFLKILPVSMNIVLAVGSRSYLVSYLATAIMRITVFLYLYCFYWYCFQYLYWKIYSAD